MNLCPIPAAGATQGPSVGATIEGFAVSYTAVQRDAAGRFMGGTELRHRAD